MVILLKYLSASDTVRAGVNVSTPTYFNSTTYDNSTISVLTPDIGITESGTLNVNGKDLTNKEVAEYFDINISRVVTYDGVIYFILITEIDNLCKIFS